MTRLAFVTQRMFSLFETAVMSLKESLSTVSSQIRVVAVGTTIADRPPHRSVQARLRIRLLPWMSSGEASIRIGMQNAGLWNPPEQEREETLPAHACALAASN